jgi:hypothetical protein
MGTQVVDRKLVVLIDADNVPARAIEPLLAEVARYGIASVKRIYGDWSSEKLKQWKEQLLPNAIVPVQQFAYTKGKNATDMALVIDAMDLLYAKTFDGFCLVSSDSDFTRLASRIRESGLMVYGFGEQKTPDAFRRACDTFIFVENLMGVEDHETGSVCEEHPATTVGPRKAHRLVYQTIEEIANDDGWAEVGHVGNHLKRKQPDFDYRSYGFSKLMDFLRSMPALAFKTGGASSEIYVRRQGFRYLIKQVQDAIEKQCDSQGLASLDAVCEAMKWRDPDYDVALLGRQYKTLRDAIEAIEPKWVEFMEVNGSKYVRSKGRV